MKFIWYRNFDNGLALDLFISTRRIGFGVLVEIGKGTGEVSIDLAFANLSVTW